MARHAGGRLASLQQQLRARERLGKACATPLRALPPLLERQLELARAAPLTESDKAEAAADMKALAELARCRLAELSRPDDTLGDAVRTHLTSVLDVACCGLRAEARALSAPGGPCETAKAEARRGAHRHEADRAAAALEAAEGALNAAPCDELSRDSTVELCALLVDALASLERCAAYRLLARRRDESLA
eukprot:5043041-Prymnesium_polylepis.1